MCVIGDQPELTIQSLEIGDSQTYSWRNVFSSINLLRILNKLTKWKHSRIMVNKLYFFKIFISSLNRSHLQPFLSDAGRF